MKEANMHRLSITELAAEMVAGDLSAVALVDFYLARIAQFDGALNAIIELNPDAHAIATDLDAERAAGSLRSPLHGIPILLKDNIATGDKLQTSAGSLALAGHRTFLDAHLVRRLRGAGAVIPGKTNMSEWANFRSSHSSSGWSSRGGQTRNPHDPTRSPGGSSSGSAVAVAAGFCAAAIGTETDGSVISPASLNGVVGFKPTVGWISRHGIIPISPHQDTAGPLTRTAADALLLLSIMAGADENDPATQVSAGREMSAAKPPANRLAGARIGVARDYCGAHPQIDAVFNRALGGLQDAGASIIDPVALPRRGLARADEMTAMCFEFKPALKQWLSSFAAQSEIKDLDDLIAFNDHHAAQVMPHFGQDILQRAAACGDLNEAEYLAARARCGKLMAEDGIDKAITEHRLDAIAAPSAGPAWPIDWVKGDKGLGGCSSPAAIAGYPHISLPMGTMNGLPLGLSLFTTAWRDRDLLALAADIERAGSILAVIEPFSLAVATPTGAPAPEQ